MKLFRFFDFSNLFNTILFYFLVSISIFPLRSLRFTLLKMFIKLLLRFEGLSLKLLRKMYEISFYYLNDYALANNVGKKLFFSKLISSTKDLSFAIEYILNAAVYTGDKLFINLLIQSKLFVQSTPMIQSFLVAISAFMNREHDWVDKFELAGSYAKQNFKKSGSHPNYSIELFNFINFATIQTNFENLISTYDFKIGKNINSDHVVVVVSCDIKYFNIYGESFIRNFFKINDLVLNIIIVHSDELIPLQLQKNSQSLLLLYPKLQIYFEFSKINIAVSASSFRFKYALDQIQNFKSNVIILDIDFNPAVDLIQYTTPMFPKDISVAINMNCFFPWGVYGVGVSFFKCTSNTELFLVLYNYYIHELLKDSAKWTVDQTTFTIIHHFFKVNNLEISLNDISELSFLLRSKIIHKFTVGKVNAKVSNINSH